jgi:lipoyl synthase
VTEATRAAPTRTAPAAASLPSVSPRPLRLARPDWLRVKLASSGEFDEVGAMMRRLSLATVCEEARCPNIHECWARERTATFMLLGDICTRHCGFCAVDKARLARPVDPDEPRRVAEAVAELGLAHAVVTSVNRDDLEDGGASHFAATIRAIRRRVPGCAVEVLIPDFCGNGTALQTVLEESPEVLNHNTETVPRLYRRVRPDACYEQTLELLHRADLHRRCGPGSVMKTKSGLMVGLGESFEELVAVFADLRSAGVDILTVGQYLQPHERRLPVEKYYTPEEFRELQRAAEQIGFHRVESGPLVRSSYHARQAARSGDK